MMFRTHATEAQPALEPLFDQSMDALYEHDKFDAPFNALRATATDVGLDELSFIHAYVHGIDTAFLAFLNGGCPIK